MSAKADYCLRPISEDDLATVLRWRNSERIRRNMYSDHIISENEHLAWFNRLMEQKPVRAVYLVFKLGGLSVGLVYFTDIDLKNNKCMMGFYLGEELLPRGTGTVMGYLGLEYAFETLNIRKLCGEAFVFNAASISLFRRLGFAEEGHLRRHVYKNGSYEDVKTFAFFQSEWFDRKQELNTRIFAWSNA